MLLQLIRSLCVVIGVLAGGTQKDWLHHWPLLSSCSFRSICSMSKHQTSSKLKLKIIRQTWLNSAGQAERSKGKWSRGKQLFLALQPHWVQHPQHQVFSSLWAMTLTAQSHKYCVERHPMLTSSPWWQVLQLQWVCLCWKKAFCLLKWSSGQ